MLGWGQQQPDGDVGEDSSEVWVVMGSRGLLLLLALLKFTDRKCARWNDFCPSWKICSLETIIRDRDKQGASASPETLQRERVLYLFLGSCSEVRKSRNMESRSSQLSFWRLALLHRCWKTSATDGHASSGSYQNPAMLAALLSIAHQALKAMTQSQSPLASFLGWVLGSGWQEGPRLTTSEVTIAAATLTFDAGAAWCR